MNAGTMKTFLVAIRSLNCRVSAIRSHWVLLLTASAIELSLVCNDFYRPIWRRNNIRGTSIRLHELGHSRAIAMRLDSQGRPRDIRPISPRPPQSEFASTTSPDARPSLTKYQWREALGVEESGRSP